VLLFRKSTFRRLPDESLLRNSHRTFSFHFSFERCWTGTNGQGTLRCSGPTELLASRLSLFESLHARWDSNPRPPRGKRSNPDLHHVQPFFKIAPGGKSRRVAGLTRFVLETKYLCTAPSRLLAAQGSRGGPQSVLLNTGTCTTLSRWEPSARLCFFSRSNARPHHAGFLVAGICGSGHDQCSNH
jgi:hypothetical protein